MIRRKLTRIEVTLDDTKELDDLFIKTAQPVLAVTTQAILPSTAPANTASTSGVADISGSASKLNNLKNIYQKQLFLLGKDHSQFDSSLESPSATSLTKPVDIINATFDSTTTVLIQATETTTTTTGPSTSETQATTSNTSYNPQPYNPSNRFQLNQDNQQIR